MLELGLLYHRRSASALLADQKESAGRHGTGVCFSIRPSRLGFRMGSSLAPWVLPSIATQLPGLSAPWALKQGAPVSRQGAWPPDPSLRGSILPARLSDPVSRTRQNTRGSCPLAMVLSQRAAEPCRVLCMHSRTSPVPSSPAVCHGHISSSSSPSVYSEPQDQLHRRAPGDWQGPPAPSTAPSPSLHKSPFFPRPCSPLPHQQKQTLLLPISEGWF